MNNLPRLHLVSIQKATLTYATCIGGIYFQNIRCDDIIETHKSLANLPKIIIKNIISRMPEDKINHICHRWRLIQAKNKDLEEPVYILKTVQPGKRYIVLTFTTKGVLIKFWRDRHFIPFSNKNDELEMELLGLRQFY